MSLSEPCSPSRAIDEIDQKWLAVSSCVDLLKDEKRKESSAIAAARMTSIARKRMAIQAFIDTHKDDLEGQVDALRDMARSSGGLVDDEIRRQVWPILARHLPEADHAGPSCSEEEELSEEDVNTHKEWNQVQLDVHRTLARFPPNIEEDDRNQLQDQLSPLIIKVISARKDFRYYQGLHDVFLTLLLVVGKEKAEEMGRHLMRRGVFHDFLSLSLEQGVCKQLELLYVILARVDPVLEDILRQCELGAVFALSWPLTWFSHALHSYSQITRVFDAFLSSHALLPIYLSASCVLFRRKEVLSSEREMPILHRLLGTLPKELPIDSLVSDALYLAKLMPPSLLQGRFLDEYKELVPRRVNAVPVVTSLSRYAIQVVFVAGAMSAAAGYYFLAKAI